MYGCNKVLLKYMLAFLCIQIITESVVMTLILARWRCKRNLRDVSRHRYHNCCFSVSPLPSPYPTCFGGTPNTRGWSYWLPVLSFETFLFIAAFTKVVQVAREGWYRPSILTVLFRDSVVYFGGIFALALVNLVVWAADRVR